MPTARLRSRTPPIRTTRSFRPTVRLFPTMRPCSTISRTSSADRALTRLPSPWGRLLAGHSRAAPEGPIPLTTPPTRLA